MSKCSALYQECFEFLKTYFCTRAVKFHFAKN